MGRPCIAVPKYIVRDIFGTYFAQLAPERRCARSRKVPICTNGAAKESNLPTRGLHGPAGFEDRMGHQTPAAPRASLRTRRNANGPPEGGPLARSWMESAAL